MSSGKGKARQKHTARKQLQTLKDAIAEAAKQIGEAEGQLQEAENFVFLCIEALRAPEVDITREVKTALAHAYDKLALDVGEHVRDALEALGHGQDGGE